MVQLTLWSLKPCLYQCHRASEFRMLKTTSSCTYICVTTSQFQLLYTKCHMIFVLKLMSVLKKVDGSQVILTKAVLLSPAPRS